VTRKFHLCRYSAVNLEAGDNGGRADGSTRFAVSTETCRGAGEHEFDGVPSVDDAAAPDHGQIKII